MSERVDRRIGSNDRLLLVIAVVFAGAAALGLFAWSSMSGAASDRTTPSESIPVAEAPRTDEPVLFTAYFPADGSLAPGPVAVRRMPDAQTQAREVLLAVTTDQRSLEFSVFSQIRFREFFLDDSGTGYVDLSLVSDAAITASASDEVLAVYALVNALTLNFEEIKQVRFLIDGKDAQTLAGHIDMTQKFRQRRDLVQE